MAAMSVIAPLRILLLSAYDAASHRYWRRGLVGAFPQHHWCQLTLPPRHFSWRIRGNPLSWLHGAGAQLRAPYDLIIATSMVDLATLKGLLPSLARTPSLCYFHENQFEFPRSLHQHPGVEAQMVNLYAALAADRVVFNSAFNRDTFIAGANALLRRLPDQRPNTIEPWLEGRTAVLPVPLADELAAVTRQPAAEFTLVWNHRWEYDKGPERLELTLAGLVQRRIPFRLHLLGEQFRSRPEALARILAQYASYLGQVGYVPERADYYRLLAQSHLVLSNSLHEFQGLAVMEAAALGALPRVPQRLSYPELFPADCCYPAADDPAQEALQLVERIAQDYQRFRCGALPPAPSMAAYGWRQMRPRYADLVARLCGDRGA